MTRRTLRFKQCRLLLLKETSKWRYFMTPHSQSRSFDSVERHHTNSSTKDQNKQRIVEFQQRQAEHQAHAQRKKQELAERKQKEVNLSL